MRKRVWACLVVFAMAVAITSVPAGAAGTKVTRCNVRLRKQANTSSDTLATISGGTEIEVLGTSGGWTKTAYKGHTGYVATENLMELTRSGYYPLHEGDESPYVKEMQARLSDLGYYTGSADGKYGASTLAAVKDFQKNNNIQQDGIAGGGTQRIMFSDTAKASSGASVPAASAAAGAASQDTTPKISADTLRLGSRGDDVKALQQRLMELGYLSGKADGIFGASTEKALIDFQKRSSLTADGKAGKVTQNLLYSNGAKNADGTVASSSTSVAGTEETTYTTLKKGVTNNAVKKMQEALQDLGYMTASPTGYFGSNTYDAIVSFQKANGLKADGVAGPETQRKLYGVNAKPASSPATVEKNYATLKEGMKSSAVTAMQKKLKELGYMSASATGFYGPQTKDAVKAFQKANSLTADGIAGKATLQSLFSSSAPANSGKPVPTPTPTPAPTQAAGPARTPSPTAPPASASKKKRADQVISVAMRNLGKPYVFGSSGPNSFDCSGFTKYAYATVGIVLPHSAYQQGYNSGRKVTMSQLQRGDLVCWNTGSSLSSHVGIYLGNGQAIHASSGSRKVVISSILTGYYLRTFSWGRALL